MRLGNPNPLKGRRGRGTNLTPGNRFERLEIELEPGEELAGYEKTQVFIDSTKKILSKSNSPDLGPVTSINPYRGCEHGCSYCYARADHEYLGLNAGLDFETKIFAKTKAPELLQREISKIGYKPYPILMSGVTDPYQPIERRLQITRNCLKVLSKARHPVYMLTKNALIERDIDLLAPLAKRHAAAAILSITTLDADLQRVLEPRASTPQVRLGAIRHLTEAGIPVQVNIAPVIPGLTDHELPAIMQAANDAGAKDGKYVMMRLPHTVKDIFAAWLEQHVPLKSKKVLNTIRAMRDGKLNDPNFGTRFTGKGPRAAQIAQLYEIHRKKLGWPRDSFEWNTADFRPPKIGQLDLFN